eukprot:352507-Chlamydomonas_euryale.AAC.11
MDSVARPSGESPQDSGGSSGRRTAAGALARRSRGMRSYSVGSPWRIDGPVRAMRPLLPRNPTEIPLMRDAPGRQLGAGNRLGARGRRRVRAAPRPWLSIAAVIAALPSCLRLRVHFRGQHCDFRHVGASGTTSLPPRCVCRRARRTA